MKFSTLLADALQYPDSTLTVRTGLAPPLTRTFAEVVSDVRRLQLQLHELGVRPGQVIGIQADASYEFIIWDLALIDLGAVPQVFPEDWPLTEIQERCTRHSLGLCISAQAGTLVLPTDDASFSLRDYMHLAAGATPGDDLDLLSRVYSSGTTGHYKGLSISRSGAEALASEFIETFVIDARDKYLFFLPLSHFQQRLSLYTCLSAGTSIMMTPFVHVFHDIARFQPTFLIGPPAFYETALATLVPRSLQAGAAERLRKGLGGNIRFMITGMAPIRRGVLEAYAEHGVQLLEAYGITEVGLVAWNRPGENHIGTVGQPLKKHSVVLADDHEVIVRAPHPLSSGYFEAEEGAATSTFLADGGIATGDIGEWRDGRLVLKGRKKDLIITGGGVKFHPAQLEARILACELVRQAVIISDLQRGDLVAVLSVDDPHDSSTIEAANRTLEAINDSVATHARIARSVITKTRFTVENEMLTRNMKPNRLEIARQFSSREPFPTAAAV